MSRSRPSVVRPVLVRANRLALVGVLAATALGAPAALRAQAGAADVVARDLALALVDVGYVAVPDSTILVTGRLPDGFPAAGALTAGARVLGGARWPNGTAVAVVAVDEAPAAARARALAALEAAGWRPPPAAAVPGAEYPYPRFVNSPPRDLAGESTRCAPGNRGSALVSARARADGRGALVRVLAYPAARSRRCQAVEIRPVTADGPALPRLGPLPAPPGVRVEPTPYTGDLGSTFSMGATASGDSADPARLRGHYARQFAAAGWTPLSVPGWDTTRTTPLFVSPADTSGGRWVGVVTAVRDTARAAASDSAARVRLTLAVAPVLAGGTGRSGAAGWLSPRGFASSTWRVVGSTPAPSAGVASLARRAPRPAGGAPVPRELVDALLTATLFRADLTGDPADVTVSQVPPGWTAPVPAAPGRRVLGGTVGGELFATALLAVAVPGTPADAVAAYVRQLDAAGWHRTTDLQDGPPAMFTGAPSAARSERAGDTRCTPARDGTLSVTGTPRAAGGTLLRLQTLGGDAAAFVCTPPDTAGAAGRLQARMRREMRAPLPALTAPAGLTVTEGTGGGGGGRWEAAAVVRGAASPAGVLTAYAPQLRAAGWTVGEPVSGPDVAVVRLARAARAAVGAEPAEPAWAGTLTATVRVGGGYDIALSVRREGGPERDF